MVRITKKTEGFEDLRWTLKAMSKSPELIHGKAVNILHSSDGTITATDGYRLHQCKSLIPDGEWEVIKNTKDEIILDEKRGVSFPDYTTAMVDTSHMTPFVKLERWDSFDHALAVVIRGLPVDLSVKAGYLEDTLSLGCHFDLFKASGFNGIQFVNDTHRAVVMPVRI